MCNKNKESDKYQGLVSTKQLSRKQKSYRRLVLSSGIKTSIMQIWFSFFSLQQNSQLLCPAKPWRSGSSGCWRWHLCLSQGELHGHRRGFFFFCSKKGVRYPPSGLPNRFWFLHGSFVEKSQHSSAGLAASLGSKAKCSPAAIKVPLMPLQKWICHFNNKKPGTSCLSQYSYIHRLQKQRVICMSSFFSNNISGFYLAFQKCILI